MRSVFFDVDGVLIHGYHYREEYRRCWDDNLENDMGVNKELFTKEYIFGDFSNVISGQKDLQSSLANELPKLGYKGDVQAFIDYWLEKDSHINTDLFEVVKKLKESGLVSLYISTNQEKNRAEYLMNKLNFSKYFEDIFYSAKIGYNKSDMAYFETLSKIVGMSGQDRPILFDDTPKVVQNANDFGWEGHIYNTIDDVYRCEFISSLISK